MRRILISILILCLLALTIYMVYDEISIGEFEVLGVKRILQKNEELDEEILNAKTTVEQGMENKKKELDTAYQQLNTKKTEYEQLVAESTEEEVKTATQFLTYNVEFLWTRIGNHAKKEGVKLKFDFIENTTVANNYNLNFTVTGEYLGITNFLYDIENDSELGFKIENFNITSGTEEQGLVATFTCKNITVNGIEKITNTEANKEESDTKTNKEQNNANTNANTNTNTNANTNANTDTNTDTNTEKSNEQTNTTATQ